MSFSSHFFSVYMCYLIIPVYSNLYVAISLYWLVCVPCPVLRHVVPVFATWVPLTLLLIHLLYFLLSLVFTPALLPAFVF